MSTLRKSMLLVTSILFVVFGLIGIFETFTAFPMYEDLHHASLPWGWTPYYGLLLIGSFIYLTLGGCGIIYRNKINKYPLLRKLCITALVYIFMSTVLWFGMYARVYEESISITIAEIILGVVTSLILLFSVSDKQGQEKSI